MLCTFYVNQSHIDSVRKCFLVFFPSFNIRLCFITRLVYLMKFSLISFDLIFLSFGFFSTAQILAFVIGGHIVSFYSISIVAVVVYLLLTLSSNKVQCDRRLKLRFLGWMIISVFASLFGIVYFSSDDVFVQRIIGYLPKIFLYLLLFILLSRDKNINQHSQLIIKGIMFGVLLNVIWSILDAFIFYSLGYSLTNRLFHDYIVAKEIRYGMLSLITGPFIRSGGLNADPANLGMFATILAAYSLIKNKYWLLILAVFSAFASISFIAFIGIIIVFGYHIINEIANKGYKWHHLLLLFVVLSIVTIFLTSENNAISGAVNGVQERVEMKEEAGSNDNRTQYWVNFVPAALSSPVYWLLGTGYMTASYPYLVNGYVTHKYEAYDPENTYFSIFFDFGLYGFLLFIAFYYRAWKITKKKYEIDSSEHNISLLAIAEGIIIAFAGYHFTLYSVVILFSICVIFNVNNKRLVYAKNTSNKHNI